MCQDHDVDPGPARALDLRLTRRDLLKTTGAVVVGAAGFAGLDGFGSPPPARASIDGAFSMAMHVHSSFSEGLGSMNSHLAYAQASGVDVVWWTDHDTRIEAGELRQTVHFTSLDDEAGDGRAAWTWVQKTSGPLTSDSTGGIVDNPASPVDTVPLGSMLVSAQSTGTSRAALGFYADAQAAFWNQRSTLTGQTINIEVLPTSIGSNAHLELLVTSSFHPQIEGRTAGNYRLSYRFGGPGIPGSPEVQGLTGIVTIPVVAGDWNSVILTPADDFAAVFSGLDVRDLSLCELNFNAVSTGGAASGYFDYLRFTRGSTGEIRLQAQIDVMASYALRYPTVSQRQGLEISKAPPHLNWFGAAVTLPDYSLFTGEWKDFLRDTVIPEIHQQEGLASYNHPYGTGSTPPLAQVTQDALLRETAAQLLSNRALGADLLEVGYPLRAGVDLRHHVDLWDVCSRNAIFLTGNGVTDTHHGTDWTRLSNDWTTSVWAPSSADADLLQALRSGRAWCGSLTRFGGALDLLVDGSCPMGSVSVSQVRQRRIRVAATGMPPGSSLQIVQGLVDLAGPAQPVPYTRIVRSAPDTALRAGTAAFTVNTGIPTFVRSQVVDATGAVVALSNPVWLLRSIPPTGIPAARAC